MAADKKEHVHADFADRIVKALPAKVRDRAEVKAGGGEYTILKIDGKSVASVRDRNVRIVHPHGGTADDAKALAGMIAAAAPEPKKEAAKPAKAKAGEQAGEEGGEAGATK